MQSDLERGADPSAREGGLLTLAVLAFIVGGLAGLVGAAFRLTLEWAEALRATLISEAHQNAAYGFASVVVACAAAAFVATWLVQRFSHHASGSGIPHVEAVLQGLVPPARFSLLPVKFFGGALAIGSGLALGREGPSVQMGATIAHLLGELFRRSEPECRALLAAGAGAGLATAFNAPIAGAVFVLEELMRRFEPRTAILALASSATAIWVGRAILGDLPDFAVNAPEYPLAALQPLFLVLGVLAGFLAVAYNRILLATLSFAEGLKFIPAFARAALIGAGVGALAWFAPALVGGGEAITQRALLGDSAVFLPLAFLVRFALAIVSYAAGAPGGLFAPLLALGAQFGALFGEACGALSLGIDAQPEAFALVGMAALFAGVVRAPITGLVLVTEMTANTTMLLPMLIACSAAMLVPTLLKCAPVYDSLRALTLRREKSDGSS